MQQSEPQQLDPRRRREGGFSIIEAMIASVVLGFGLLTLAVMQLAAMKQASMGHHSTDAAAIARTHLEQIRRVPWTEVTDAQAAGTWTDTDWPGATGTVNTVLTDVAGIDAVTKTYTVEWRVNDVLDAGGDPRPCLRDIELRVTWPEEDRSSDKTLQLDTRRYNWGGTGC